MYTLLVIDMQKGFLDRFDEYDNTLAKSEVIRGCQRAVIRAIADGAEIIDVNYSEHLGPLGPTIPEIADLWKGYKKLFKGRVSWVEKRSNGGGHEVMRNGIAEDEIRVCGVNAGACVRDTVWELDQKMIDNQHIRVLADAVANCWDYDCSGDLEYLESLDTVECL
jgi:hypothetical protein